MTTSRNVSQLSALGGFRLAMAVGDARPSLYLMHGLGTIKEFNVSGLDRKVIIHVTESFGGGVAAAIRDYARNYPGAEHHLVYAPRDDAPIESADTESFASVTRLAAGHARRIMDLRRYFESHRRAIVHAHSSFAGAYVRAAFLKSKSRPIIYTPHCYGFERRDSGLSRRLLYWGLEWMFAFNTTSFAACSPREQQLSRWPFASAERFLIPNVAPKDIDSTVALTSHRVSKVVGAGRLGPQKDPWFFRNCIVDLRKAGFDIDATWVGGGDEKIEQMLKAANIDVTGWLPRERVLEELVVADVYIHSALWEGFPIAVLEASRIGVPIVARNIAAFDGVDMPMLIDSSADLVEKWKDLTSAAFRKEMVLNAMAAFSDYNDNAQAEALQRLYRFDSVSTSPAQPTRRGAPSPG